MQGPPPVPGQRQLLTWGVCEQGPGARGLYSRFQGGQYNGPRGFHHHAVCLPRNVTVGGRRRELYIIQSGILGANAPYISDPPKTIALGPFAPESLQQLFFPVTW